MKYKRFGIELSLRTFARLVVGFAPLLYVGSAPCDDNVSSDKRRVIEFIVESVGDECTSEHIQQLNISKSQCDIRHLKAVSICSDITLDDSPERLDHRGRLRATLVFSLCRGVVLQETQFEIEKWEPTITRLLEEAVLETDET